MTKWVVITGASSGIGAALAISFLNSGYKVLGIGRNEVAMRRIKSSANKGKMITVIADLSKYDELEKALNNVDFKDGVQYLIHCAATTEPHSSMQTVKSEALQNALDVNSKAPISLTQKLTPYFDAMTRVLFLGSDYVDVGNKIRLHITGAYAMSKAALRVAVEYLRRESQSVALIGYLNPGSTDTPMFKGIMAALNKQGIFNSVKPAEPRIVAEFIKAVLEKTSNEEYSGVNWDFREEAHHQKIHAERKAQLSIQIKLKL